MENIRRGSFLVITDFGKKMRVIRINCGEVMYDMAQKLGVTSSYLSAVENGKRKIPHDWVEKIGVLYNLSDEQKKELKEIAELSADSVKLNLEDISAEQRAVAMSFARKFDSLDLDTIKKLQKTLNDCKRREVIRKRGRGK